MTSGRASQPHQLPERASPPSSQGYLAMEQGPDFVALRRAFRRFVFPMTVAFLAWYLLYVLLSAYARDFMGHKVVGNINVGLVMGLGQFASTFLIAFWYSRYAASRLDPLAGRIRDRLEGQQP